MKLRWHAVFLYLLAAGTISSVNALPVSNWDEFLEHWEEGGRDFTLTGDITLPGKTPQSEVDTDATLKDTSTFVNASGSNCVINGGGFSIGDENHDHSTHTNEIARSFYNAGTLTMTGGAFVSNYVAATRLGKAGAFYNAEGSRAEFIGTSFSRNHLKVVGDRAGGANGGAIFNGLSISPQIGAILKLENCTFDENFVNLSNTNANFSERTTASGGAIINNLHSTLTATGTVFTGNYVTTSSALNAMRAWGGALFNESAADISDSAFIGNSVRGFVTGTTPNYQDEAMGGAIYNDFYGILNLKKVRFEGNYVSGNANLGGGAIANTSNSVLNIVDCSFINNYVEAGQSSKGGAIYYSAAWVNFQIVSDEYDTYFRGNKVGTSAGGAGGWANAIHYEGVTTAFLDFRARKAYDPSAPAPGSSLIFYDPVVFQMRQETEFNFNKPDTEGRDYKGRIVFTGEDFSDADDVKNYNSWANDKTQFVQHGGEVVIRDKAILGSKSNDEVTAIGAKSYEWKTGVLEMTTAGRLYASSVTVNTANSWKESILRADNTACLTTDHLDINRGISFDLDPFLVSRDSGLQISAGTATLGGFMGIADNRLDYYMDNTWKTAQKFLVLDFIDPTTGITGSFNETVMSHLVNSNIVGAEYGWGGTWSYDMLENEDGTKELYAVWTPTVVTPPMPDPDPEPEPGPDPEPEPGPGRTDILPELAGGIVMNSLWSTVSNMHSLSGVALGQLNATRYKLEKCSNYWATGLGDFDMHRSVGRRDGYDYNGFGYAVGADFQLCPDNVVFGVAFGNLYGKNKSRDYFAEIKQASYIGMIYGGWLKEFDAENALNVTGTASYGLTTNKLNTRYSDGFHSRGKWDNDAMRFTLKAEWLRNLGDNWTLGTFVGAEYDGASQKAFSETGDRPRHFGRSNLHNLALPVGVGVTKQIDYSNGMKWINSLTASYIPDVYRKNPESSVTRLTADGFSWTARGVDVARHGGRLDYSTRWIINPTWSTFAGYAVEYRKNAVYQDVNIGASVSF